MISRQRVLDSVAALPSIPEAVSRLTLLLSDPLSTPNDYEAAIRSDLAMTANLLRLANSAHFKRTRSVESVRQAFVVLGVKRVYELAVAASVGRVIPARIPGYNVDAQTFWLHSVAVAVLAERIGYELKLPNLPDLTFTAGLLHDIGKLIIGAYLGEHDDERSHYDIEKMPFIEIERRVLGLDHMEIGQEIATRWALPHAVAAVIGWHHSPSEAPPDTPRTLIDLIHVADGLSYTLGLGVDSGELSRAIDKQAVDRLGLKLQLLEHVASQTFEEILELEALLGTSWREST